MDNDQGDADGAGDRRRQELEDWLAGFDGLAGVALEPASGDASFRRYFRLVTPLDSYIAMDAPPPAEDCRPFVRIAGYLESMGISAPVVLEADFERGFLLMSDLGSSVYLDVLQAEPARADALYGDALRALARLQENGEAWQHMLPPYDADFVARELDIFVEWLCGRHVGIELTATEQAAWQSACDLLIDNALSQPRVFMHRDYHSRNLMLMSAGNPGVLDFQDAVEGPVTYDLVSLLKDCYIAWPPERVEAWARAYYDGLDDARRGGLDVDAFLNCFDLMGAQRHLKAAGIFARLKHRDGKDGYLADIPRTLDYVVDTASRHPALTFVGDLIAERVMPALESA